MKLFDYDSHASNQAKKLSNPNVTANLSFFGLETDNFKKAEISFYLPSSVNSSEFTFVDAIDSFESKHNLSQVTIDQTKEFYFIEENNEWNFYFKSSSENEIKKQFKIIKGDEKDWLLDPNQNTLCTFGSFNSVNLKIKKSQSSDVNEDTYVYIKCVITRQDNKFGNAWGRILLRKESASDSPNLSLEWYVTT